MDIISETIRQISPQSIIIDHIESYPTGLVNILKKHQHEFDSIKHIFIDSETWYDKPPIYNYYNNSALFEEIDQFLYQGNYLICLFHVSRLLAVEIENIINYGFQKTTTSMLKNKISLAHKSGYFTKKETIYLINHLSNHNQNPFNLIFAYTNLKFLAVDSKSQMRINSWWGG